MRSILATVAALATLTFATSALAQDDAHARTSEAGWFPQSSAPAKRPAPAAQPVEVVTPKPGQAAAAAPSNEAVAITATCTLGDHAGIDDAEARTAADVLCDELAKRGATNTNHEVRMGKLGGRTLVTLAARNGNAYDEVRTFVSGLDELDVAAPRMVTSLVDGKPMAETKSVDTVLANEQHAPKLQQGQVECELGMFGMSSVGGEASAPSAGVDVGIGYRAGDWGIIGSGRLGGIGSADNKIASAMLDMGGRYYLSSGDAAPFIGAGFEISYLNVQDNSGSGIGAYGTIGVEMLRTHHMGFVAAARVDAPFYALEDSKYAAPISVQFAMVFH